jgi:TolB-like protein
LVAIAGFLLTIGYFGLLHEPESGGLLASRKRFWRLLLAGLLLSGLIAAGTIVARRSGLIFGDEKVSLAVLPFADLSPARDKAFFAEGIGEEILSTLAAEKGIKVLGRTSARQIERDPDPKTIRAALGVTHLLEGSTRAAGDRLRVNVRLISTKDGSQLWEEEYKGRLADVFAVQDQIADAVVQRLRGTFFTKGVREAKSTSISAYQAYLAARALMRTRSEGTLAEALGLAKQVVRADPNYAAGHAMLAEIVWLLSDDPRAYGSIPVDKAVRIGAAHARTAIRLSPEQADGHAALGLILTGDDAVVSLNRAIELDPSRADIRVWLGLSLNELGEHDAALEHYRAAAEIEPLWPLTFARYVKALGAAGKANEALRIVSQFQSRGGTKGQVHRLRALISHPGANISESLREANLGWKIDQALPDLRELMLIDYNIIGLGERAPAAASERVRFSKLFYARDYSGLENKIRQSGANAWKATDGDVAFFYLASVHDWRSLAYLFDHRPGTVRELCLLRVRAAYAVAHALRASGRRNDFLTLLHCLRVRNDLELRQAAGPPDRYAGDVEFDRAQIAALEGNKSGALQWLDRAVAAGWVGRPNSGRLEGYPQFDFVRGEPRLAAIQRRIISSLAKERGEVFALD